MTEPSGASEPEPTGAWAVVLDRDGRPWVRHLADGIYKDRWKAVGFSGHYPWNTLVERLGPLTVVFKGEPSGTGDDPGSTHRQAGLSRADLPR